MKTANMKLTPAEQFFYANAGFSYDPKTQTPEEGKIECARRLAKAEKAGSEQGLSFGWQIDQDTDSSDFDDSEEPWQLWQCACRSLSGEMLSNLCGIDFGKDGEPYSSPYRRVVEAELSLEAIGEK